MYAELVICFRCAYTWNPEELPAVCPRCNSERWNDPATRFDVRAMMGAN